MTILPNVIQKGVLNIRGHEFSVAVLSNKTRVIITPQLEAPISTLTSQPKDNNIDENIPLFIDTFKAQKDHPALDVALSADNIIEASEVAYLTDSGETRYGYDTSVLCEISEVYLTYRDRMLKSGQEIPAELQDAIRYSQKLVLTLAYMGMTALIDEATGYEKVRSKTALQDSAEWKKSVNSANKSQAQLFMRDARKTVTSVKAKKSS